MTRARKAGIISTLVGGLALEAWAVREAAVNAHPTSYIIHPWVVIGLIMVVIAVATWVVVRSLRGDRATWLFALPLAAGFGWAGWTMFAAGTPVQIPGVGRSAQDLALQLLGIILLVAGGGNLLSATAAGVAAFRNRR